MNIFHQETVRDINVITLNIQALDAANVKQVSKSLSEALRGEGHTVVDLGALRYFDVSGFAAILKWAAGSSDGPTVRLCSQSGTIQALFELLRAETVVQLYQSDEEAIASFSGVGFPQRKAAEARHAHAAAPLSWKSVPKRLEE